MRLVSDLVQLARDRRGSLLPIVVGGVMAVSAAGALAVDLGAAYMLQGELARSADAVALAAVVELPEPAAVRSVGLDFAQRNLRTVYLATSSVDEESPPADDDEVVVEGSDAGDRGPSAAALRIDIGRWNAASRLFTVTAQGPNAVRVRLSRTTANGNPFSTFFARLLGVDELSVAAEAVAMRSSANCVYVLDPAEDKALALSGGSDIEMPECGIQVSSTSSRAFDVGGGGHVETLEVCIAGDYNLSGGSTASPMPKTACAASGDPLAGFAAPGFGGCNYNDVRIGGGSHTFSPGVYCGGIEMTGGVDATFEPGIYVIKDGELKNGGGGSITGHGVAFYFTGVDARAEVSGGGDIVLTAPTSGPLRGFIFYQGPFAEADLKNKISGGGTIYYEGMAYFPDQHVEWSGGSIGTTPPWTVFVAKTFLISGGGAFRAGADFGASSVPSPLGVAGGGNRLVN